MLWRHPHSYYVTPMAAILENTCVRPLPPPHPHFLYIIGPINMYLNVTSRKWCGVILTSFWRHPVWNTCTRTHLLYQGAIQLPWGQNRHPEAKTVTLRARPSPSGQNRHPQGKTVTLGDFSIGLHWGTYPSVPPKFFFFIFFCFFLFWSISLPCMMLWCHSDVTQTSAILKIHMLEWKYMC